MLKHSCLSWLLQLWFNHFYHDLHKNVAFLGEITRDPDALMKDLEMDIIDSDLTEEFGEKCTLQNNGENHAIPATSTRLPQESAAPRRNFGATRVVAGTEPTETPLQTLQRLELEVQLLHTDATINLPTIDDTERQAYARGVQGKSTEYEALVYSINLREIPGSVDADGSDRARAHAIFTSLLSTLDTIDDACEPINNGGNPSTPRPYRTCSDEQPPAEGGRGPVEPERNTQEGAAVMSNGLDLVMQTAQDVTHLEPRAPDLPLTAGISTALSVTDADATLRAVPTGPSVHVHISGSADLPVYYTYTAMLDADLVDHNQLLQKISIPIHQRDPAAGLDPTEDPTSISTDPSEDPTSISTDSTSENEENSSENEDDVAPLPSAQPRAPGPEVPLQAHIPTPSDEQTDNELPRVTVRHGNLFPERSQSKNEVALMFPDLFPYGKKRHLL